MSSLQQRLFQKCSGLVKAAMTQHGLVRSPSGPTWACHAYTTTKGSSGSPPNAFRPIEELAADEEENDPTLYYESAKEPDFNRHTASTGTSGLSVSRGSGSSIGSSHKRSSAASASSWLLHMMPFPEERDAHFALYPSLNASQAPFSADIAKILASPVNPKEIQIKPDGIIYLPEIKYRQILFKAFGAGGWSILPRGPHVIAEDVLTREYALICLGQLVSIARGSATIRSHSNAAASSESVRSNALMRCCKDLGIAHELWDPVFIAQWKNEYAERKMITNYGKTTTIYTKKTPK